MRFVLNSYRGICVFTSFRLTLTNGRQVTVAYQSLTYDRTGTSNSKQKNKEIYISYNSFFLSRIDIKKKETFLKISNSGENLL